MHIQARDFTLFVKLILPEFFINKKVLDVGSGDINGNNKFLFNNCEYEGNDVIEADNVTIISKTKDLPFEDHTFDTIISTECFEHDPEYKLSLIKIYKLIKPGGLFFFTCASTGRPEHGTRSFDPKASYGTIGNILDMIDYYKNITEYDLNDVLNLNESFETWDTYYNEASCDLYFLGIKKKCDLLENKISLPKYNYDFVISTSPNIYKLSLPLSILVDNLKTNINTEYSYLYIYEIIFSSKKYNTKNILEIGISECGDIKLWYDYFIYADIYGIGYVKKNNLLAEVINKSRIKLGNFNPYNINFIENILKPKNIKFDIIIDDGPHMLESKIFFIKNYLPLLSNNGILVIQDIQSIEWIDILKKNVPDNMKQNIKIYDLTKIKNKYDNILLTIDLSI